MKIEVMVDKDNTHFSYKFECDKVIDGSRLRAIDSDGAKLVIMKKTGKTNKREQGGSSIDEDIMETIAVFNYWTFWRVIEEQEQSCENCGKLTKNRKTITVCERCVKVEGL